MTPAPVTLDTIYASALKAQLPRVYYREQEHLGATLYGPALRDLLSRGNGRTIEDLLTFNRAMALKLMHGLHCGPMARFVDGHRLPGFQYIEDYIRPRDIAAIEVFDSPDFVHEPFIDDDRAAWPPGTCRRIVLVWSKEYKSRPWAGH